MHAGARSRSRGGGKQSQESLEEPRGLTKLSSLPAAHSSRWPAGGLMLQHFSGQEKHFDSQTNCYLLAGKFTAWL